SCLSVSLSVFIYVVFFFFFFQAEDGIRDGHVTGVQTCALPIYRSRRTRSSARTRPGRRRETAGRILRRGACRAAHRPPPCARSRSEERRVGKECRSRWAPEQ